MAWDNVAIDAALWVAVWAAFLIWALRRQARRDSRHDLGAVSDLELRRIVDREQEGHRG